MVTLMALAGCAALPGGKPNPHDRFERFNRSMYKFNTALDRAVLRPVARTYVKVTPSPVRTALKNVLSNMAYATTVFNDFLQGKFNDGASDAARLVVNTTIGVGGLFDPASRMGMDRHEQDFGETLGHWGVHSGPYLMLPLIGPSTVRDSIGLLPDEYTNARAYIKDPFARWGLYVADKVDERSRLLDTDALIDSAFDPYAFVRDAWLQRREYLIHGDAAAEE
jgi:phospholipid-binding lipoprotein MlaA